MKKRILSMVLVLCMVVGMLPTTAWGFDLSAFSVLETEIETQVITPDQLTVATQENSDEYDTETLSDNIPTVMSYTDYFSGSGSSVDDPFIISTDAHWNSLATAVYSNAQASSGVYYRNGYYKLENDISIPRTGDGGDNGARVGGSSYPFNGKFDGGGFTISVPTLSTTTVNTYVYSGVFGYIGSNGEIKDLTVSSGQIKYTIASSTSTTTIQIGGLAGYNAGTITNCHSSVGVNVDFTYTGGSPVFNVGGLVGRNEGTILDSSSTGDVDIKIDANRGATDCTIYTGGFVGYTTNTIINCTSVGEVEADIAATIDNEKEALIYAGGFAGGNTGIIYTVSSGSDVTVSAATEQYYVQATTPSFTYDSSSGSYTLTTKGTQYAVSGNASTYVGGLVGYNKVNAKVINGGTYGSLSASSDVTFISNSWTHSSTALSYAGGLVGKNEGGTVENCYNHGTVEADTSNSTHTAAINTSNLPDQTISTVSVTGKSTAHWDLKEHADNSVQTAQANSYAAGLIASNGSGSYNSTNVAPKVNNSYSSTSTIVATADGKSTQTGTSSVVSDPDLTYGYGLTGGTNATSGCYWYHGAAGTSTTSTDGTPSTGEHYYYKEGGLIFGEATVLLESLTIWVQQNDSSLISGTNTKYDGLYLYQQWVENSRTEGSVPVSAPTFLDRINIVYVNANSTSTATGTAITQIYSSSGAIINAYDPSYAASGSIIEVTVTPQKDTTSPFYDLTKVQSITALNVATGEELTIDSLSDIDHIYRVTMPDETLLITITFEDLASNDCNNNNSYDDNIGTKNEFNDMIDGTEYDIGSYYLAANIEVDKTLEVTKDLNLCFNGFTITYNGSEGVVFNVSNGATLTLCGCNESTSTLLNATSNAKGVTVNDGSLVLTNGLTISGFNPAVHLQQDTATFTLENGYIKDGGQGVYVEKGLFSMKGGEISDNSSTGIYANGGGVWVGINGSFHMSAGTITNNSSTGAGNGVYVDGIMTISGAPKIDDNGNDGVYLTRDASVSITGTLAETAKVYITSYSGNLGKLSDGIDEIFEYADYKPTQFDENGYVTGNNDGKSYIVSGTTTFYRSSQEAIYSTKVDPYPADWQVTFDGTIDGKDNPEILTTTGTDPYKVTIPYSGMPVVMDFILPDDNNFYTATIEYRKMDATAENGYVLLDSTKYPTDAGTYHIYISIGDSELFTTRNICVVELEITPFTLNDSDYLLTVGDTEYFYLDASGIRQKGGIYSVEYNGSAQKPSIILEVMPYTLDTTNVFSEKLVLGTDFTVEYSNNTEMSTEALITLKGIGNYSFTHTHNFHITSADTDLFLFNRNQIENQAFVYGSTIRVQVQPQNGADRVQSSDASNYDVTLYVRESDGSLTLLDKTSTFQDVNSLYEFNYDTSSRNQITNDINLKIGSNTLVVEFKPIETWNGSSEAGNFGRDTVEVEIILLQRPLLAKVISGQSREYDGTNLFTAKLDLNESSDDDNNPLSGDEVGAWAYGFLQNTVVGEYQLYIDEVKPFGADADYYSLLPADVNVAEYVKITEKNLLDTDIVKNHTITVMKGVGTYATPTFSYTVGEEEVAVPGSLTYTHSEYNTYDKIVSYLKTLEINSILEVPYTFVTDSEVSKNYLNSTFTGKITFIVVDIKFDGIDEAIVVKDDAIYGDVNNFYYDPSKFVANIGTSSTTGAYFLTVTDYLGAKVTDLSLLKVGEYNYSVSFTSYDGAYIDSFVTEGTFKISPRPVTLEWDSLTFAYDSTEQAPSASVTNIVWVDDVSIDVTGAQTNVGEYTAVLSLDGADKANYSLSLETITFKIIPAEAKGIVTVSYVDADGSTALSAGDTLEADITSVTPQGGTVFYHWYRDDILMSSAVWPTYMISSEDSVGTTIRCEVTFSGNTTGTISTVGMDVGDYFFTGSVSIAHADGVLTATVTDTNTDDYTILWTGVANSTQGETYEMDLTDYGRTVTVTVIANHGSGYCGNFNSATSVAASKPYTPEFEVEAGDASVTVSWTEPFHGGAALENYVLTVTDRDGNEVTGSPFTFDTNLSSYTVMNLVNNNVYTFTFCVTNAVGTTYAEQSLTAVPRADADVETDGEITTSTTTEEYEDEDGNIITTTVVTEINSADGSVRVTTTVSTVAPDGTVTEQSTMTYTDGTGVEVESAETYSYKSDDLVIYYEISSDEDGSESFLTATTGITDIITLPVSMLQPIVDTDNSSITFVSANATVSFDNAALETIFTYANPYSDDVLELLMEYTAPDQMPMSIRERLSDAFIMNLTLKLGNVIVSDFEPGSVTITLPYTKYDTSKNVSVYHVAESGSMTRMNNAEYAIDTKTVTFTATHFSYYAVIEEANRFADVYVNDYYYDAVQWGVENGITTGSTPSTFNPHAKCTRAEAITMLWKAMGSVQSSAYMPFTDVTASDYYFDSFRWAYGTGITTGTKPNLAGPFDVCTRDQIVTFLWIANGKQIVDEELYFSDVPIGGWYTEAIRWAVAEGVTAGSSATTFSPDNVCTRAEIITFLYKCANL